MQEIDVRPLPLEILASILAPDRARMLEAFAGAQLSFGDRTIWHVNATASGGGVAEMLQSLLAYALGAQIRNRWLVLDGDHEFFVLTKRIHNRLHGAQGDGGPLGDAERGCYERVLRTNVEEMMPLISSRDIVVLHDPQTAGMADALRAAGVRVAWRCHVGTDSSNGETDSAWAFLMPYIERADAFVFSRAQYVPSGIDHDRVMIIPPSIDPFSTKSCDLEQRSVLAILSTVGLISGASPDGPTFRCRDGSVGTVRRRAGLITDGDPPPRDARLILQVSRWDRLKDMAGVLEGFARMPLARHDDDHLMLVGPDVLGVTDDPEATEVLAECRTLWRETPDVLRRRIHLASIPMDDVDENAIIVNALQRHAYMVVQKSLVEGFGLTVTEAMWKARPVIASGVGGIQDQIVHERDGLLLDDPYDLDGFAAAVVRLLDDPEMAERLGAAGHARVKDQYLGDRHLAQFVELFERLST